MSVEHAVMAARKSQSSGQIGGAPSLAKYRFRQTVLYRIKSCKTDKRTPSVLVEVVHSCDDSFRVKKVAVCADANQTCKIVTEVPEVDSAAYSSLVGFPARIHQFLLRVVVLRTHLQVRRIDVKVVVGPVWSPRMSVSGESTHMVGLRPSNRLRNPSAIAANHHT